MNQTTTRHLLCGMWGAIAGASLGYWLSGKHFQKIADAEIASVKDEYARRYKGAGYSTPEEAYKSLVLEEESPDIPIEVVAKMEAVDEIIVENGYLDGESTLSLADIETMDQITVDVVDPEDLVPNVSFEGSDPIDLSDSRYPETVRPDDAETTPYVISVDEYMSDNPDHSKFSLQYYSEDDVLTDETDAPIRKIGSLIGDDFASKFGERSGDPNVVYIRNEARKLDAEICLNEGSFAKMVYGITNKTAKRGFRFPEDE